MKNDECSSDNCLPTWLIDWSQSNTGSIRDAIVEGARLFLFNSDIFKYMIITFRTLRDAATTAVGIKPATSYALRKRNSIATEVGKPKGHIFWLKPWELKA